MTEETAYNEHYLLEQLQQGSEEAFTSIYGLYWEKLFFMAHKRLQSAEDAREVIQEVFLTLWQKRAQLHIESLPLYLSAMTRYSVYRQLANSRRKDAHLKVVAQRTVPENRILDVENKQLLELLAKLSNELPEKHRLVFIHHKLLDRPIDEVAGLLGVSVRTAEGYSAKVMEFMRRQKGQLALSAVMLWLH